MKCPKCRDVELEQIEKHGIELDRCPTCGGMWFDQGEVDELEDQRLDVDEVKGTMVVMEKESDFACPHCGETLNQFDYRYYGLTLEYCPAGHGYWLDQGEDEQVLELMDRKIHDRKRKVAAEEKFYRFLGGLRNPGFWSKIKNKFK